MKEKDLISYINLKDVLVIKDFLSNIDPIMVSLSGVLTAVIIEGDYDSCELNVIGNWLELVGQFVLTTASQQQLLHHIGNKKNNVDSKNQDELIINYLKKLVDKLSKL